MRRNVAVPSRIVFGHAVRHDRHNPHTGRRLAHAGGTGDGEDRTLVTSGGQRTCEMIDIARDATGVQVRHLGGEQPDLHGWLRGRRGRARYELRSEQNRL